MRSPWCNCSSSHVWSARWPEHYVRILAHACTCTDAREVRLRLRLRLRLSVSVRGHTPAPRRPADPPPRRAPPPAMPGTLPLPATPARAHASAPRRRLPLAVPPCAASSAAGSAAVPAVVAAAAAAAQTRAQWLEACARPAKAAPMRTTRQHRQQSASLRTGSLCFGARRFALLQTRALGTTWGGKARASRCE